MDELCKQARGVGLDLITNNNMTQPLLWIVHALCEAEQSGSVNTGLQARSRALNPSLHYTYCVTSGKLCLALWLVAFLRGWYWDRCWLTSLSAAWTVGWSGPSVSLPTTPSCVVWSTCWREGVSSRCHPWQDWEAGPCKPYEVQQGQMQDLAPGLGQSQAETPAG